MSRRCTLRRCFVTVNRYVARTTSGGHNDALECSSGCIAGIRLLLNCITNSNIDSASDFGKENITGRERLHGMSVMQFLSVMCSSAQNTISVLALDTLCQLVALPVISISVPFNTRSTRVYVSEVERALKSMWGPAAIKCVRDAFITADSRATARDAAQSLHAIFRDTWGTHWCIFHRIVHVVRHRCLTLSPGTQLPACWGAIHRLSASPPCPNLQLTRGAANCQLEWRTTRPAQQLWHRVVGILKQS